MISCGWLAKLYIHQYCVDIECHFKDLAIEMDGERELKWSEFIACLDNDNKPYLLQVVQRLLLWE